MGMSGMYQCDGHMCGSLSRIAGVEQFHQIKQMIRGIEDALSSSYFQTFNEEDPRGFLGELPGKKNSRRAIVGKQN